MEAQVKLNVRTILIMVFFITSIAIIFQSIVVIGICIFLTLLMLFFIEPSRKKWNCIGKRFKNIFHLIFFLMIMQILFRHEGELLFSWFFIKVYSTGLNYGIVSSLRFVLIILVAGLLFDIPFYDYLLAIKNWKIPFEISFIVASVIHFIPIFAEEFQRTKEALELRTVELSEIPLSKRAKAYIIVLFPVLARSISNVKFRAISLELRAFRLYPQRTYLYSSKLKWFDYSIQICCLLLFVMIIIFRNIFK